MSRVPWPWEPKPPAPEPGSATIFGKEGIRKRIARETWRYGDSCTDGETHVAYVQAENGVSYFFGEPNWKSGDVLSDEEDHARARLAAAAPDLYRALERFASEECRCLGLKCRHQQAWEALEKAKGSPWNGAE